MLTGRQMGVTPRGDRGGRGPRWEEQQPMWQSLLDAYRERIVDTGREPLFLLLLGLIGSFLFIRFSVRMIRRGTSWWPGNVTPGGLHIHHVVFGQGLMVVCGVGAFAVRGDGGQLWNVLAVGFGIGCGLVLDEFALVLHLKDVYWSEQGRASVDAVILVVALIGLLLLGELPLGGFSGRLTLGQVGVAGLLLVPVLVCLFKGKIWTGLIGVMLPPLAVVGMLRLARPASPWARWRYHARPRRLARAERREERFHRRVVAAKTSFYDVLAGAPDPGTAEPAAAVAAPGPAPAPPPVPAPPRPAQGPTVRQPVPRWRFRCATAAEWYLRVATLLNLVAGLIAPFRDRVQRANSGEYFTPVLMTAGFTAALFAGLLAVMVRRRKRAAWLVTTAVVAGYAALCGLALAALPEDRAHPFNWVSAGLTTALLLALLAARPAFRARGERGNLAAGLTVLAVGGVVMTGVGTVVLRLADEGEHPGWADCARYVALRLVTMAGLVEYTDLTVPGWLDLLLNVLGAGVLLLAVRMLFRSPRGTERLEPPEEGRLRALLARYGERDSLGYLTLRRDRAVCWAPDGRAAVVHRVLNGVSFAAGDPVGDPEAWAGAVAAWRERVREAGWVPAVIGPGGRGCEAYRAVGLRALEYGTEGVVTAAGFVPGPELRAVRARVTAAGYRAVVRRHRDVPAEEVAELVRLADAWRHGRDVRDFVLTLGRFGDPADGDCLLAEALDERGRVCALVSLVPWGGDGLALDLIRRDRESDDGLVSHLLTEVLLRAGEFGLRRVSLNFTMAPGARWRVLRLLGRWWRLDERQRAAARFLPARRSRYLLYEKSSELPAILAAGLAGEGLLTRRRLRGARGAGA
ncbi:phosphatidylglycerol lysyltransferase domain-containing protein [Kitasatospora sp. NPDC051853]|uniref:phosphatidylglycerol lysyltransferase domain-containing protein n=1 Tax=Kitasatospora sp. NPDC051853 TaxID=3364058 RepID=UPI0037BA7F51